MDLRRVVLPYLNKCETALNWCMKIRKLFTLLDGNLSLLPHFNQYFWVTTAAAKARSPAHRESQFEGPNGECVHWDVSQEISSRT